jgi:hypothetical protein
MVLSGGLCRIIDRCSVVDLRAVVTDPIEAQPPVLYRLFTRIDEQRNERRLRIGSARHL